EVCDGHALPRADRRPPSDVVWGAEGSSRQPAAAGQGDRGWLTLPCPVGTPIEIACPSTRSERLSRRQRKRRGPVSKVQRICNEGASNFSASEGPSRTVDDNE